MAFPLSPTNGQTYTNASGLTYVYGSGGWKAQTGTAVKTVSGRAGDVTLTKTDVNLANVDNTSDANKPVSTAQQVALDAKTTSSRRAAKIGPTSVRGIGNRSGWPNQATGGQLTSGTIVTNISKDVTRAKLLFVGATQYTEVLTGASNPIQAKINCPVGSDNWYTVTFDGGAVAGVLPSTGQYRLYESDWCDFLWPKGVTAMCYLSCYGAGAVPTMGSSPGATDFSVNGTTLREFTIQSNSTSPASGQLDQLNTEQLRALSVHMPGTRLVSGVAWNGTVTDLSITSHGFLNFTGNKILVQNFVNSGVSLNGLWTAAVNGSNLVRITMGDPGTVTQNGVIRTVPAPTAAVYNSGTSDITITRAAHGRLPGDTVCIRGFTTGTGSINYDWPIKSVTTDTFTFDVTFNPGSISFTNGYYFNKYGAGANYHFRPVAFLGESDIECTGIVSDSTSSTTDFITDPVGMVMGVGERCVGNAIPAINISATNDGLFNWFNTNPTKHEQRQEVLRRYTQTLTFGFAKNDENNFNLSAVSTWIGYHTAFWNIADFAAHKATGKNKLILTVTRNTGTRNGWQTKEGQISGGGTGPTAALDVFQKTILGSMGSIYNAVYDLNIPYCEPGLRGIYKTSKRARSIIVTTDLATSVIAVDPTTPISLEDDGEIIALVGAESTGNLKNFGTIKYISPTSFYFMNAGSARFYPKLPGTIALTAGRADIGAHYAVSQGTSTTDVVHESTNIMQQIDAPGSIGLRVTDRI